MTQPVILIVEDDAAIRRGIVDAVRFAGYAPLEAAHGDVGLKMALGRDYDLLLLDLVLPGTGGLEILRYLREARPTQPVIILSALGEEANRVAGLKLGADDYVVKPFSVKELLARVEAVLRRSPERPRDVVRFEFAGGCADLQRQEIRFPDGSREEMSTREVELLGYLVRHAGRAVSRDELLANVWRISPRGLPTRTVDMHIARLREKLRDDPQEPGVLVTVRGKGYMIAVAAGKLSEETPG